MTTSIKENTTKVTKNVLGAIVGGVAVFYAAKKLAKVENKWALTGAAVIGVLLGASIQAGMIAKKGAPTAATVKA